MKIVPLQRKHMDALYDKPLPHTVRGFAAVDGDKVLGVVGAYAAINAQAVFLKTTPEIGAVTLVKLAKRMFQLPGKFVVAKCDPEIEAAGRFLARFGFVEQENGIWTLQR